MLAVHDDGSLHPTVSLPAWRFHYGGRFPKTKCPWALRSETTPPLEGKQKREGERLVLNPHAKCFFPLCQKDTDPTASIQKKSSRCFNPSAKAYTPLSLPQRTPLGGKDEGVVLPAGTPCSPPRGRAWNISSLVVQFLFTMCTIPSTFFFLYHVLVSLPLWDPPRMTENFIFYLPCGNLFKKPKKNNEKMEFGKRVSHGQICLFDAWPWLSTEHEGCDKQRTLFTLRLPYSLVPHGILLSFPKAVSATYTVAVLCWHRRSP